jgi:shikimate dehydrogenase
VPSASLIEKCCLIANPAAGDPTQYLIEQAFSQRELDWRFMTFEVDPARLGDAMRGIRALGFRGVKIGEPFHQAVIDHLDEVSDLARRCGSVNCITANGDKLAGDNTEGPALVELVRTQMNSLGRAATIIGSGRLARVVALALADGGVQSITVVARKADSGEQLAKLITQHTAATATFVPLAGTPVAIPAETELLVNATSLSTANPDVRLPLNIDSLSTKALVADVTYNTSRTWLTRQAAERGNRIIDGLSLYVNQTALAFKTWTGAMPDTVAMRDAAEEFLGV